MPGRTSQESPTETEEDFTGHVKDESTGLHYAGARYYSAAFGRWTTTDPILGQKGPKALLKQDARLLSMSPYNYAFGNPATLTDPTGIAPLDWFKTKSGKIKYDEDVQSQADLEEGQTYLGENVLVETKSGGAQLLTEGGEVKNVFEGARFSDEGEGVAFALSSVSAAAGKSQLTLEMAGEAAEGLVKRNSSAGALLSLGSFIFSAGSGNSESTTYQTVNLVTNLGFAIGGAHPVGAIAGFGLDAIGAKKLAVESLTLEILQRQVDRTIERQERVEE
mgnify:CR=1 FL=1